MFKPLTAAALVAALFAPLPAQALDNEDMLALVAMPLAVAAVSEITDVPMSSLMDVVSLLNNAGVPPVQFVEVVRYVPIALVVEEQRDPFIEYIRLREQEGLRGIALVDSIEDRFDMYGLPDLQLDVFEPRLVTVSSSEFVPVIVRDRVTAFRASHPHGGPPGQLKKSAGVQTGAEIVHGSSRKSPVRVVTRDDDDRGSKVKAAKPAKPDRGNSGKGRGNDGGGKGKGKGKG